MKKILLTIFTIAFITHCLAQDTLEIKNKLADKVTEIFHVIKGNEQVKVGLYHAVYKRNIPVASGNYVNGKRTGTWFFFDSKGELLQTYNYNLSRLQYEAPELQGSDLRYLVDNELTDTDRTTKPVKIGGRYFGYLPYLGLYRTPFEPNEVAVSAFVGVVELLISPLGRLADYKVHLISNYYDYDRTTTMDLNLFKDEDKQFVPATINSEPVLSRIVIKCKLNSDGGLDFY